MLVSIGTYDICDGTLEGGVAISDLRALLSRIFDVVIPIVAGSGSGLSPVAYDREITRSEFTFTVKRVHADLAASDAFILTLESTLPRRGEVKFVGFDGTTLTISDGCLVSHELTQQIGATTFHTYHIIGAGIVTPPSPPSGDALYVSLKIRANLSTDGEGYIMVIGSDPDVDFTLCDGGTFGGGIFEFYGWDTGTGESDISGWLEDTWFTLDMKFEARDGGGYNVTPRVDGVEGDQFFGITASTITGIRVGIIRDTSGDNSRNIDDVKIGTTDWGSSDIFSSDFASAIVPPFDSITGSTLSIDSGTMLAENSTGSTYASFAFSWP